MKQNNFPENDWRPSAEDLKKLERILASRTTLKLDEILAKQKPTNEEKIEAAKVRARTKGPQIVILDTSKLDLSDNIIPYQAAIVLSNGIVLSYTRLEDALVAFHSPDEYPKKLIKEKQINEIPFNSYTKNPIEGDNTLGAALLESIQKQLADQDTRTLDSAIEKARSSGQSQLVKLNPIVTSLNDQNNEYRYVWVDREGHQEPFSLLESPSYKNEFKEIIKKEKPILGKEESYNFSDLEG